MRESLRTLTKNEKFELKFLEGVVEKSPKFIEAWISLGDLYTKGGFYQEGLAADKKLVKLRGYDPIILYNLACSYSLVGDLEASLKTIKKAFKYGYRDFDHLKEDSDLKRLRGYKPFVDFFSKYKTKV